MSFKIDLWFIFIPTVQDNKNHVTTKILESVAKCHVTLGDWMSSTFDMSYREMRVYLEVVVVIILPLSLPMLSIFNYN